MTAARRSPRRRGVTLVELSVVSMLMALLALLLMTAWSTFARPAAEVVARTRLAREAALARSALAADLGGFPADPDGRLGGKDDRRFLDWSAPGGNSLRLEFDGGPGATSSWFITYALEPGGTLARWDETAATKTIAARDVLAFAVAPDADRLRIDLEFAHRGFTRSYTLEAIRP